jgi:hypothetical protein
MRVSSHILIPAAAPTSAMWSVTWTTAHTARNTIDGFNNRTSRL